MGPLWMVVMLLFFQGTPRDDDGDTSHGSRAGQDATD